LISQSNSYATAHTLRGAEAFARPQALQGMTSMTALLLENIKLITLFTLIGSIIGLSRLDSEKARPARRKRLRKFGRSAAARLWAASAHL
jgi:hypothetical protein